LYNIHSFSRTLTLGTALSTEMHDISTRPSSDVSSKGKGKAVPLQAWSGPDSSRKLRFPDLLTTAQDGGKFVSLSGPVTCMDRPRGFQEVKVPRFLNNGTGWWYVCQP
jgi:hypothetical protein